MHSSAQVGEEIFWQNDAQHAILAPAAFHREALDGSTMPDGARLEVFRMNKDTNNLTFGRFTQLTSET
jgi:hypothetical protein